MRSVLRFGAALALAGYCVFVVYRNKQSVSLEWFPGQASVDLQTGFVVLGSVLVGIGLAALAVSWPIVRLRLRLRRQTQRVSALEQEVHGLRTLPLGDTDPAKSEIAES